MEQNTIAVAEAIVEGHKLIADRILGPILDGSGDDQYKDVVRATMAKMAEVEAQFVKRIHKDELTAIQKVINGKSLGGGLGLSDYANANKVLGFPDPSDAPASQTPETAAVASDPSEAAVFGLFIYSYSCCHSDKSGIFIGVGVGVKGCGDGYRWGGCP